jgi:hypothetical protein
MIWELQRIQRLKSYCRAAEDSGGSQVIYCRAQTPWRRTRCWEPLTCPTQCPTQSCLENLTKEDKSFQGNGTNSMLREGKLLLSPSKKRFQVVGPGRS